MRLLVSEQALRDLTEIHEYIRAERPMAADRMIERFWRTFEFLCDFPNSGHVRSDVRDARYRFKRVKSFLIGYRVDGSDVRIVRVLHGARDFRPIRME